MAKPTSFETKTINGKPNPKYVDLLDEDKPIAGQQYACFSFISPENILKQKEIFLFNQFVKKWDFNKSMEKFIQFLNFISYKYNLSFETITDDFTEFVKDEKPNLTKLNNIEDDYKTFLERNEEELNKQFDKENNFQTSIRGMKLRGCFPSKEEAETRAKLLREINSQHNIYIGPVGLWIPWDPNPDKIEDNIYMEEELNQLMFEKRKNEALAKQNFEERIKETKEKAIEENIENAKKSGNVLTQTIDDAGNLVGIANMNTQESVLVEKAEKEEISVSDIRSELFESENVVIGKSDNGQSLLVSGPFANVK
jgi:hypothetical protein